MYVVITIAGGESSSLDMIVLVWGRAVDRLNVGELQTILSKEVF